ncbi:hypothetical protein [Micromonospora auratinigra]|uniref:Spore-associated protein A n=1 Tax=Micromonospora auratinigra TaxID=261654 RepID=A0A1A8Z6Y4_9ACTN|nr:hypothetical protein [Micromonospora auratinigra]SBT39610.1 hypothetical protein GA0070611_0965 [Micromonospora auratinigra]
MRRLSQLLVLALVSTGVTLGVGAQSAQAADCSGNLINRTLAKTSSGVTVGELVVYYNSSTGKNCARFNHLGPAYGVKSTTYVWLTVCASGTAPDVCRNGEVDDSIGDFAYYAGPVYVYAPNNCVRATGNLMYQGSQVRASTPVKIGC